MDFFTQLALVCTILLTVAGVIALLLVLGSLLVIIGFGSIFIVTFAVRLIVEKRQAYQEKKARLQKYTASLAVKQEAIKKAEETPTEAIEIVTVEPKAEVETEKV